MAAEYPASCGLCGATLTDEKAARAHIGPCYVRNGGK